MSTTVKRDGTTTIARYSVDGCWRYSVGHEDLTAEDARRVQCKTRKDARRVLDTNGRG